MITIEYQDAAVQAALAKLASRAADMRGVLAAIGQAVRSDIMERFETSSGPDGVKWKPLTAAAIISRARRNAAAGLKKRRNAVIASFASGAKPLLDTGQLRNSIRVSGVSDSAVTVSAGGGSRQRIAAIHHFGGMAGRGRKAAIPARPFMGVSARGKEEILSIIVRHMGGGS